MLGFVFRINEQEMTLQKNPKKDLFFILERSSRVAINFHGKHALLNDLRKILGFFSKSLASPNLKEEGFSRKEKIEKSWQQKMANFELGNAPKSRLNFQIRTKI